MSRMRSIRLLVAILLATGAVVAAAQSKPRAASATGATFTFAGASETFVVPQKVDLLLVEVWGAGGGGGGSILGFVYNTYCVVVTGE